MTNKQKIKNKKRSILVNESIVCINKKKEKKSNQLNFFLLKIKNKVGKLMYNFATPLRFAPLE